MRKGGAIILSLLLSGGALVAQGISYDQAAPTNDSKDLLFLPVPSLDLGGEIPADVPGEVVVKNSMKISGPLVYPFKAKSALDFSTRLLRLVNPFSKAVVTERAQRPVAVQSMAWSTRMGWDPGRSAWPGDTHHEAQLWLFSLSPVYKR